MKKVYFAFGAAMAAIFAFSSCNKEISDPNEIIKEGIPFEINASSVDTKTSIDDLTTSWVANDAINLFHAVAGTTYTNDGQFTITAENLASKKFTGKFASPLEAGNYDWYAIYPYNENISTPANTGTTGWVTVGGKTQTQTGNSSTAHLCKSVCPLYGIAKGVASNETPNITMNHLSSIVEVKVTNNSGSDLTVSSVSFTGTEDIVGTYFIDFTGSPINYKSSGESYVSTKASLSVENGTAIADGASATFYIAIKPFTATSGKSLTVSVNGNDKVINLTKDVAFTAGKIKTINYNYNFTPSISIGPDWNSVFSTSYDGTISDLTADHLSLSGTVDGISINITNGSSKNGYVKTGDFRLYNGYTVTLTAPSEKVITDIKTTVGGKTFSSGITANTGNGSIKDNSYIWSGKATTIVLTITGTVSFNTIFITTDAPEISKLPSPEIQCSSQTSNSLTFTWNTDGNASGYQVSIDGGNTYLDKQTAASYTWTGLNSETSYTIYVKAIGDNVFYSDSDVAQAVGTTTAIKSTKPTEVTLDFKNIDGFSSWSSSYVEHKVEYSDAIVTFASANKSTSTITDQPVTKGNDVIVMMKNNQTINSLTFTCTQWGEKSQTITLYTSKNGGTDWTSTTNTSSTFELTVENLSNDVNAIKFTFSSQKNQIGIKSLKLNYNKID